MTFFLFFATAPFACSCPGGAQNAIPAPIISVQPAGGGVLRSSEQEWEQGWVTQVRRPCSQLLCGLGNAQHAQHTLQGGDEMYTVRMSLAGQLGAFSIHVCDAGGQGGESLLSPDDLHYELVAGGVFKSFRLGIA